MAARVCLRVLAKQSDAKEKRRVALGGDSHSPFNTPLWFALIGANNTAHLV